MAQTMTLKEAAEWLLEKLDDAITEGAIELTQEDSEIFAAVESIVTGKEGT